MEPIPKKRRRQGQQLPPLPVTAAKIGDRPACEVFKEEGAALLPRLQDFRRDLHQNPEIGLDMPRTQKKVLEALDGLPLEIQLGHDLSSVVAVLRGGKRGERPVSVLLRADMDALPIREQTGDTFASTNGNMHACGHDMHTAGLIGAVTMLCDHREELYGDVIFMFQPGEEGPGGAQPMIEEGVLDAAGRRPIAAYGLHVGPQDRGTFHHVPGPMMASSSNLEITVFGKGGHGSRPHDAVDPVAALAEIQMAIQVALTRRFDANDPIVITVTNLRAGDGAINVIPDHAKLGATVRILRDENIEAVRQMVIEVAGSVASSHRCTAKVDFEVLYTATKTDPREDQFAASLWGGMFGAENIVRMDYPMMASEDFGAVLSQVPGTFMWFGTANPNTPEHVREWNHSPLVRFDDSVLGDQAAALAAVAFERLAAEEVHPSSATKAMRAPVS
ncbi:M20 family metallopeptidase [Corynebacterium sp.]|uniref:M20 metallopeptidase family protein n=1 Tax=Corynebacterium sp. TaxID=1720 RepID=UPI0026DC0A01|nr:M20 family metallopeptidase [Corynebacterium sp.]MDO5031065.1 M20 family metallopeptidase [Corynebacterium sp.]